MTAFDHLTGFVSCFSFCFHHFSFPCRLWLQSKSHDRNHFSLQLLFLLFRSFCMRYGSWHTAIVSRRPDLVDELFLLPLCLVVTRRHGR